MRNSSATDKARLLNPWTLVVVVAAVGGLLWMTFNKENVFEPDGGQPDAVSANYAELLLTAHPQDDVLRIKLLDLLITLGEYPRARQHLNEWPKPQATVAALYALQLDALELPETATDTDRAPLVERLAALDRTQLPVPALQRMALLALLLQAPILAAHSYEELAVRDPAQRLTWLSEAGKWALAGERPGHAADIYLQLEAASQTPEEHKHHLRMAFDTLLAADRGAEASALLAQKVAQLNDPATDPAWLEKGVETAVAHKQVAEAETLIQQWRTLEPGNLQALHKEFTFRLFLGDQDGAWSVGQEILHAQPDNADYLQQMARLGEWQGETYQALDYWMAYLKLRDDPAAHEHAWRLSIQLFDFDHGIPLLASILDQRALTDAELDALVFAHEQRGTPQQAEAWLRASLKKYPKQRLAWMRLSQNLENTEQFPAKAKVLQAMSRHFPLTVSERVDQASVHLKFFDTQGAWQALDIPNKTIDDPSYWEMRAALAWELERDDELQPALERLLAINGKLSRSDEEQLFTLYSKREPEKALAMMVTSWERTHNPQHLVVALQLAQELQDWGLVARLLNSAQAWSPVYAQREVLAARGALAAQQGQFAEAERLYKQGLANFHGNSMFRERLLWLYVDQGDTAQLTPLLQQWKAAARSDSQLWLPFAAASQMVGLSAEALAWYRMYLKANPNDWLVQASYADALEAADYRDSAQRLRLKLMGTADLQLGVESSARFTTWLRLLASSYSPRKAKHQALKWQDGSMAMLQLWFERLLAQLDDTNQAVQKNDWLNWARYKGLKVDRFELIQEALRNRNSAMLQQMLANAELDPAQQVEALNQLGQDGRALGVSLTALGDEQPVGIREQLRRQAVEMLERKPQGIQLGWERKNYGGLDFSSPQLTVARNLNDEWYASLVLGQGRYDSRELDSSVLGQERNALLTLQRQLVDGSYRLIADISNRKDHDRNGFGLSRAWQLSATDEIQTGLDWHRQSDDTGLMRALGQHDGVWLKGQHGFSARDQLSWSLAQNRFSTRLGDSMGSGQEFKVEVAHTLEFEGPNWVVRGGVDYQRNSLGNRTLDDLSTINGGPVKVGQVLGDNDEELSTSLTARDVLQERYGQVYIGNTWRRGFPGALNRTRPQYTWLVDITTGWQWVDKTFNYSVDTGIGMQVLGGDELAVKVGYQSAPQGGAGSGGTLGVSYGLRFGR
ncbi:tetratricopeptide repeat protein [Pseudomonas sp. 7P_10.2_Bac1]|uniref:tetratricopeptide repeat protein n=1 Tax=Pseudomonas sp. 7P_10.2_Bac1 TaxID=2971614 RepID=UPI0021C9D095|nr:tetratricopeptide repeat protein [Pseudomonas sp. 7P_10.2_Bac1]MCU1729655.1 tetratricopeptide repeat protein [Pseudomonas sp. 7P_10.2_Bac1]